MDQLSLTQWEKALRHKVGVMRELGVAADGGLILGPVPLPKAPVDKTKSDPLHVKRGYYANLFGRTFSNDELEKLPEVA